MVSVSPVSPHDLATWLPLIQRHLDVCIDISQDEIEMDNLIEDIKDGERQAWVALKEDTVIALALTRVNAANMVEITHCAGEKRKLWEKPLLLIIGVWAKERGSHCLRVLHRLGWSKFLKSVGFKQTLGISELRWEN